MRVSLYLSFPIVFLLVACSPQDQAPIQDLGKKYYGYGHGSSEASSSEDQGYSHNSYMSSSRNSVINAQPVHAASVPAVSESDLPPPGQAGSAPITSTSYGSSNYGNGSPTPFNTAPSKPLEPVNVAAAPGTTAPAVAQEIKPVSSKDGISLIWPVTGGKIISHFTGEASDGINIGIANGEPIVAAASGTVVYSGNDLKDYGNMVILRHDNAWLTAYANTSRITVKKGAYVKQGDIIAYVGASGGVKTPQLHFTLRRGKTLVDPEKYLPKN